MRQFVSARAGLIASAIMAFYPAIWVNGRMMMAEPLFLLAFSVAILFAYKCWKNLTIANASGLGIGVAVMASTRPEAILLFPLVCIPVILGRRNASLSKRLISVFTCGLFLVGVFGPWTIYNQRRLHAFVPMSTGAGPTLLQGNCSDTFYGSRIGYYSLKCLARVNQNLPPTDGEVARDAANRAAAMHYMGAHVQRIPMVMIYREARMWGFFDPKFTVHAEAHIERGFSFRLGWAEMWAYWVVGIVAIPGIWLFRRRRIPVYPMLAMIAVTAAVTAISFGLVRYRVGADLCLIIFAATSIDAALFAFARFRHAPSPKMSHPSSIL